ncbi:hypothetical protein GCM10023165_39790 [Variovorax defluvii]|uniref:Uncharacterized protein n=1 Tax=Variovorax defluvii TaxID=913761 RepID=A0ABP8I581_9BURK
MRRAELTTAHVIHDTAFALERLNPGVDPAGAHLELATRRARLQLRQLPRSRNAVFLPLVTISIRPRSPGADCTT